MSRLKEIYIKSSDPYERGKQHGSMVSAEIAKICEGYRKSFERKGYTWEEALGMAMEYVPYLDEEMPELMKEVRGIADGAGVDLAVVMVLNTRYELLKFKKGVDCFEHNECTCFCVTDEATKDGETIAGQNWDNSPFIQENLYVIHIDEENGTKIVGLCEPAQLIRSGMNSHGISVNCSTLLSTHDVRGIAVPTNFMRRRILQCHEIEEAKQLVERLKPCVSINYVIGSAAGDGVVYETNPKENYRLDPVGGIITQGNDFLADPSIDRFVPADSLHKRHFRGQRMEYLLKKKKGEITVEYIQECLKDHYEYPGSICNHMGGESLQTIASMLYCLNRGYALISWGNPCENEYEKYTF